VFPVVYSGLDFKVVIKKILTLLQKDLIMSELNMSRCKTINSNYTIFVIYSFKAVVK